MTAEPCCNGYRLHCETSTREQLWSRSSDLDKEVTRLRERNDQLVDELRSSECAASTANGTCPFSCPTALSIPAPCDLPSPRPLFLLVCLIPSALLAEQGLSGGIFTVVVIRIVE